MVTVTVMSTHTVVTIAIMSTHCDSHHSSEYTVVSITVINTLWTLYWLVLCANLTQAGVITEKVASVGEVPP